ANADRYELTVSSGSVRVSMDGSAPDLAGPAPPSEPPTPSTVNAAVSVAGGQGVGLILDGIEKRLAG
ncbi:MAG: hypothetical protein M3Z57_02400, partial [Candidatus Dormibacteraeota bacterium]|nr:hypothetical protein [Candidatus Dormibacteraeota bacterium]